MEIEYVIDGSRRRWLNLKEVWLYRELLYFFTWRDVKIKYKQTVLGFLWAVLQPLFMMIIFSLFFGRSLNIPSAGIAYPIFVFSGLLIWNIFSSGLVTASNSMINNAMVIKKIYFPKIIILVSSVLGALFDFLMAFIVFIPVMVYYGHLPAWEAAWCWPVALVLILFATIGPGSLIAALNVKYRDFRYVIPFAVQVLFFVSPVIYPVEMLPHDWMHYVIALSPVYAPMELFRFPLTGVLGAPELLWMSVASNCVFTIVGVAYFRISEDYFADLV